VGYAGTDTFEVLSISSNGVANLYRYTIKKIPKRKGELICAPDVDVSGRTHGPTFHALV
jgi:hypothetical protein